jgi:hypothetical protein
MSLSSIGNSDFDMDFESRGFLHTTTPTQASRHIL